MNFDQLVQQTPQCRGPTVFLSGGSAAANAYAVHAIRLCVPATCEMVPLATIWIPFWTH